MWCKQKREIELLYINVPVSWELAYIHEQIEKPYIVWRNVGTHPCGWHEKQLWVAWPFKASLISNTTPHWKMAKSIGRSNVNKYADLLKPHLSPVLPHWKRTRVLEGQILTRDLWSLTYLPDTEKASAGSDKTIGRCTNEKGKTMPKAWGKSLPEDLTANPKGGDPQVYWHICTSSTHGGRVGIFFSF